MFYELYNVQINLLNGNLTDGKYLISHFCSRLLVNLGSFIEHRLLGHSPTSNSAYLRVLVAVLALLVILESP